MSIGSLFFVQVFSVTVKVFFHDASGTLQFVSVNSPKETVVCGAAPSVARVEPMLSVMFDGSTDGNSDTHSSYCQVPSGGTAASWHVGLVKRLNSWTAFPGGGGGGGGPGGGGAGGKPFVVPLIQCAPLHDASVGFSCTVPQNQKFAQSFVNTADCVGGPRLPAAPDENDILLMLKASSVPVPSPYEPKEWIQEPF